ncbi:MAG: hypothetical protein EOO90_14510 [Pedobacter sp.]|nr:MAG: hypothetical protein EOO90_14510 [Pedobacter sp.]
MHNSEEFSNTIHLAKYVHEYLQEQKRFDSRITSKILSRLFEILYFTSMKTEEGEQIKVNVVFIDPKTKNNSATAAFSSHSWELMLFKESRKLDIKNLLKLSRAADPWSSSIGVYLDNDDNLIIHGLIDQAVHTQSYINHETDAKPEQAGIFQASIIGIGSLSIVYRFDLIATLKQNILATSFLDVLNSGPIASLIKENTAPRRNKLLENISEYLKIPTEPWLDVFDKVWKNTLSRLLIQIRSYNQGGAFLITKELKGIKCKYELDYSRLAEAVTRVSFFTAQVDLYENKALKFKSKALPPKLASDIALARQDLASANEELRGAIRFVASSSCVDGLILFNSEMEMVGFGGVIEKLKVPEKIFFAGDTAGNNLNHGDPKDLGTRHQSMITFCGAVQDSVGFVVSKDGDVRAIMALGEGVVVWENIRTQKYIRTQRKSTGKKYITIKKKMRDDIG